MRSAKFISQSQKSRENTRKGGMGKMRGSRVVAACEHAQAETAHSCHDEISNAYANRRKTVFGGQIAVISTRITAYAARFSDLVRNAKVDLGL